MQHLQQAGVGSLDATDNLKPGTPLEAAGAGGVNSLGLPGCDRGCGIS